MQSCLQSCLQQKCIFVELGAGVEMMEVFKKEDTAELWWWWRWGLGGGCDGGGGVEVGVWVVVVEVGVTGRMVVVRGWMVVVVVEVGVREWGVVGRG